MMKTIEKSISSEKTVSVFKNHKNYWILLLAGFTLWLVFINLYGLPLVVNRHYQVDEFQNSYRAILLASHASKEYFSGCNLALIFLGKIGTTLSDSASILQRFRIVSYVLLIFIFILIAFGQPYFNKLHERLIILFIAAFSQPLWKFGIEIRQDVSMLVGLLILFSVAQFLVVRPYRSSILIMAIGGFFSGIIIFISFKSSSYALPYLILICGIVFWQQKNLPFLKRLASAWPVLLGFISAVAVANIVFLATGNWSFYYESLISFIQHLSNLDSFGPKVIFYQIMHSSFVVLLLAVFLPFLIAIDFFAQKKIRPASIITLIFGIWSLIILFKNPTPFPYNTLHIYPFLLFASLDVIHRMSSWRFELKAGIKLTLLIFLISGFIMTRLWDPYLNADNFQQIKYIQTVEKMANPDTETYLDGVGMVLTLQQADPDWFLHSSIMNNYYDGQRKAYRDIITEKLPAVCITNYRWDWLMPEDHKALRERYVKITENFWVLGQHLTSEQETFEIYRSGRYWIDSIASMKDPFTILLNEDTVTIPSAVYLEKGINNVAISNNIELKLYWIGTLTEFPYYLQDIPEKYPLIIPFF